MGRKGNTFALLVGLQAGAATVGSSMEGPQKWICLLTSTPTSGTVSEGTQNTN